MPYTDNFDVLVALISHLGATDRASRTPSFIAADLGFTKENTLRVLEEFPAFFRKSRKPSKKDKSRGDHFFTLHLRYSRRKIDNEEEGDSQPLSIEEIGMLISLVSHRLEQEQESSRMCIDLKQRYRNLLVTNVVTMIVGFFAVIVTILTKK